jgi:hypothetical protein
MHWIYPSIGGAFFGFGLGSIGDATLTLVIDSYRDVCLSRLRMPRLNVFLIFPFQQITGDAFTGIAFLRNAISIGIPFAISPWMERDGLQNMFITCGFISLGISLLIIPMVFYGKRSRRGLATRYYRLVEQQGHNHSG